MRNRFPGVCYRCGQPVAKGEGHFQRIRDPMQRWIAGVAWKCQHAECAIKARRKKEEAQPCPRCGWPGMREAVTNGGTIIWRCPVCVQTTIGLDDVPYTFPLFFGDDGKVYV